MTKQKILDYNEYVELYYDDIIEEYVCLDKFNEWCKEEELL